MSKKSHNTPDFSLKCGRWSNYRLVLLESYVNSGALVVSATESPLPAKELDQLLSQALLPLFSKTLRNGLTVIPSVEMDHAKKQKKRA
jgi:hypothetical protein